MDFHSFDGLGASMQSPNAVEMDLVGQIITIPAGDVGLLDVGYQGVAYGTYTINGILICSGELHVIAWPTA